jgi:hypothetical protein
MENGQGRASSLDHLDYCCQLVSEQYGKPDILSWTNSDYVKLGYVLYKKTHVQISPNTLKRIFGKIKTDVRYYPQRATRDALALYIGYNDWEKFTNARSWPVQLSVKTPPTTIQSAPFFTTPLPIPIAPEKSRQRSTILADLVVIALAILLSYNHFLPVTYTLHSP